MEGNIEFQKTGFSYPSRPTVKVLRELSYLVKQGQNIALVGPSGCGKSTCIQLLQRFYNINSGQLVCTYQFSLDSFESSTSSH